VQSPSTFDTLLISASFFGYAEELKRHLEARGRRVALFEDRPATDTMSKAIIRVGPELMRARANKYFADIAQQLSGSGIRDVLVIKGEALTPSAIANLRRALPNARFTLYFWDSYRNMPRGSQRKVGLFDRAYTFDPHDARRDPRLSYRPLFFLEEYGSLRSDAPDIDVLFFGTMHSDRYAVLKRIRRMLPRAMSFHSVQYYPSRALFRTRKLIDPAFWQADMSEFIFTPLKKQEILRLISRARIVVDIERSIQSGLTMRTIEMLGARKKLLTTNAQVASADFFDARNIAVIDRRKPIISPQFLDAAYAPPPPDIVHRYSLSGWVRDVLPAC
jgi:hypothetical protein